MKKVFALLFVGSMLTFAACQTKPKTEEAGTDSTATMMTDTTMMATDSAAMMSTDTAATMATDSAK
ncbi:hypothetical protein [Spirosoma fluminis]